MLKTAVRVMSVLSSVMFCAAHHASTAEDESRSSRRKWRTLSYFGVDDMSRMRLAVCDWLDRWGESMHCDLASSGGGATIPVGPLLVDVGGGGMRDRHRDAPDLHNFNGGTGSVSVGIPVINTRALRIYPLLGVGGGSGKMRKADESGPGWVLAFFTTGIGIDLRIRLLFFHVVLGLRAGFRHEIMNTQLGDGPEFDPPGGLILRFIIGV